MNEQNLVDRLLTRAEIRRNISSRKSVQEGKPDRISDLLEEAAKEIIVLRKQLHSYQYSREYFIDLKELNANE